LERIRLKDIAARAGVAVSTVSRVINKEKFISNKTKNKVIDVLKELNYIPEWSARSLRSGKTNIIGVIIPSIGNYFFSSLVLGAELFFRSKGLEVILLNTSFDEKIEENAIDIAVYKNVEGIILATVSRNINNIAKKIKNFDIPFVLVDNMKKLHV